MEPAAFEEPEREPGCWIDAPRVGISAREMDMNVGCARRLSRGALLAACLLVATSCERQVGFAIGGENRLARYQGFWSAEETPSDVFGSRFLLVVNMHGAMAELGDELVLDEVDDVIGAGGYVEVGAGGPEPKILTIVSVRRPLPDGGEQLAVFRPRETGGHDFGGIWSVRPEVASSDIAPPCILVDAPDGTRYRYVYEAEASREVFAMLREQHEQHYGQYDLVDPDHPDGPVKTPIPVIYR